MSYIKGDAYPGFSVFQKAPRFTEDAQRDLAILCKRFGIAVNAFTGRDTYLGYVNVDDDVKMRREGSKRAKLH
jgi:hypothetical protein